MSHLTVGGRRLFHQRRGAGEPLLLIQGMSGTHLAWGEPFVADLERDFDVVAYDHRGIGRAPVDAPFTIAELARTPPACSTSSAGRARTSLGISMGGMVAQELALAHPERIRTLTLGCTYCGGEAGAGAAVDVRSSPPG